jgi:hypothetical protein
MVTMRGAARAGDVVHLRQSGRPERDTNGAPEVGWKVPGLGRKAAADLRGEGPAAVMYEVVIPLQMGLAEGVSLDEAIERVTDELAAIDATTPGLLDFTIGSDLRYNTAVVEVTVMAGDGLGALNGAVSWVRAAFHAAGARTPGWEGESAAQACTTYEIDQAEGQVEIRQVVDA